MKYATSRGGCNSASQCRRDRQADANSSEPRQLHARMTQIEACDQAEDVEFDTFDPTKLKSGEAVQIDFISGATVRWPAIESIPEVTADCVRRQCKTELRHST